MSGAVQKLVTLAFHPAEFIYDELLSRGWTTWAAVQAGGGDEYDCLALDLYICVQEPGLRVGSLADLLARAFDVSADFFTNLETQWLECAEPFERFEPPAWIFGASPLQPSDNPENASP